MAKAPELVRGREGDWKVRASFSNGRYVFSLSAPGVNLLIDGLEYIEHEHLSWNLFKLIVLVGDAYLPSMPNETVDVGRNLARPDSHVRMYDAEIPVVASYLRQKSYSESVRTTTML